MDETRAKDTGSGSSNDTPTLSLGALPVDHPSSHSCIGRYRIIRLLGEGGMGAVYEAEQDQPRRRVALKLIRGALASAELLRRFEQESQALGRLHHPGIAQIYEAGSAEAGFGIQPFFAMELIDGQPLVDFANGHRLGLRQRLQLMIQVCDAVQHAHQRGFIHRDLKPGNILVEESGQPKILDFGLARATDSDAAATRQTDMGQLLGTLAYMSPEQVLADPLLVDTRTDVYALGVILYELLAGKMPYTVSRQLHEAVQTIQQVDPARLSAVSRAYRGDIETIVAKALEKDKNRRYASAEALAGDLRRYLEDQPITAKPASTSYQLRKFARRHKALVAGFAAVLFVLILGVVASTWQAIKARRSEKRAQQQSEIARAVNDFLQHDLLAQASAFNQSKPDPDLKVRTALDRAATRVQGRFATQPLVEASIRQTIGSAYLDLNLYTEAQQQFERALALRRLQLGEDNADTVGTMSSLAALYERSGKLSEAESLYKKSLEWSQRHLGLENRTTLMAMNGLAVTYSEEGRFNESAALFEQLVPVQQKVLGEDDLQTLRAEGNLAATYDELGRRAEARDLLSKALERKRQVLGDDNPETLDTTMNLGLVYEEEGDYAKGETLFSTALASYRRILGKAHRSTINAMNTLADLYRLRGENTEAKKLAASALEIATHSLGNAHPLTFDAMFVLARTYADENRNNDAEALLAKVLEGRRHVLGIEHPDTLDTLVTLGEVQLSQRRYPTAEVSFREASSGYEKTMPNTWQWFLCQNLIGGSIAGQGKNSEAETLLVSGYDGMVQQRASMAANDVPRLKEAGDLVVRFYDQSGQRDKASEWRNRIANSNQK